MNPNDDFRTNHHMSPQAFDLENYTSRITPRREKHTILGFQPHELHLRNCTCKRKTCLIEILTTISAP